MMQFAATELPAVLGTQAADTTNAANTLRKLVSDDFRSDVSTEATEAWITKVLQTHGKLVEILPPQTNPAGSTPEGNPYLSYTGKFLNGEANIKLVFDPQSVWTDLRIIDILVDGVSPHDSD